MALAINFVKQLEQRRKEALEAAVEEEEGGGMATRLKKLSGGGEEKITPVDVVMLVFALAVCGGYYFMEDLLESYMRKDKMAELDNKIRDFDAKIAEQAQKLASYQGMKSEIESYERQEREYQEKIALIKQVRIGRNSVVRMVDVIVKSLPPGVWLSKVNLSITGATGSAAANPSSAGAAGGAGIGDVKIEGQAKSFQDVSLLLKQVEGISFFPVWKLDDSTADPVAPPTAGSRGEAVETKSFKITAPVVTIL